MKRVLVLGGSYFAGRAFTVLASRDGNFELHIVNRGSRPLGPMANVTEFVCDRNDAAKLVGMLPAGEYDAVVDFCAYHVGDISKILEAMHDRIKQYIFISTSSVYDRRDNSPMRETDRVMNLKDVGRENFLDDYIREKLLLETELMQACTIYRLPHTIIRPNFLYGPFNYAPRESWYIERIVKGEPIPVPVDANTSFSFCYVADLARLLMLCCGEEKAYRQIYNVAGPEEITYKSFMEILKAVSDIPFVTTDVTVQQVLEQNIPLPFPLEFSELLDGTKARDQLGLTYTPFADGMAKAFKAFRKVFAS